MLGTIAILNFLKLMCIIFANQKNNILLKDIERMASYKKLINSTSEADVDYVKDTIKRFYKEYIESLKEELY